MITDPKQVVIRALAASISGVVAGEDPHDDDRPSIIVPLGKLAQDALHIRCAAKQLTGEDKAAIAWCLTVSRKFRELNRKVEFHKRADAFVFTVAASCSICTVVSLFA